MNYYSDTYYLNNNNNYYHPKNYQSEVALEQELDYYYSNSYKNNQITDRELFYEENNNPNNQFYSDNIGMMHMARSAAGGTANYYDDYAIYRPNTAAYQSNYQTTMVNHHQPSYDYPNDLHNAQHNHPPYYSYGNEAVGSHYDSSNYSSVYPTGPQPPQIKTMMQPQHQQQHHQPPMQPNDPFQANQYGASSSNYTSYADSGHLYQQTQQQPQQHPMSTLPPIKSNPPPAPTSLNLKPGGPKNPYGQTGPYGSDATNQYVDYYRKLYYPYDPITGEYMKDATPPGDTSTTNMLPNVLPDSTAAMVQRQAYSSGRYSSAGINRFPMMANYYGQYENEKDSLLLCCDFLIPRPNIKCLLITLFIILVLIVLIAVIRFLASSGGDQSEELATLLEQMLMFLLIGAFLDLVWIIGIYFTSRRTRHQIANILSCVTNQTMVEHSLGTDGYVYSNTNAQHLHHQHPNQSTATRINNRQSYGNIGSTGLGNILSTNYRYANNYV